MLNDPREFFAKLNDPRRQNKNLYHPLENVIFIALTAFICGYNDWVSVEDFAKENRSWFEKVLNMPYGIPSHDTFGNVMKMIDKDHFEPPRDCRRLNFLREYGNENTKLYP